MIGKGLTQVHLVLSTILYLWSITDFGKLAKSQGELCQTSITPLRSLLLPAAYNSHVVLPLHWLPPDKAKKKSWPLVTTKAKAPSLWKKKKNGKMHNSKMFPNRAMSNL